MKQTLTNLLTGAWVSALVMLILVAPLGAIVPHEGSPAESKLFMEPEFEFKNWGVPVSELDGLVPPTKLIEISTDLSALGLEEDKVFFDMRSGALNSLVLAHPLVPGPGFGNSLTWAALGMAPPADDAEYGAAVMTQLQSFLAAHGAALGVDASEFEASPTVGVLEKRRLTQIHIDRQVNGVPVRFSSLAATINSGNLLLLGVNRWGTVDVSTTPTISAAAAEAAVAAHLAPFAISDTLKPTHLEIVSQANGADPLSVTLGEGYTYRLAWVVTVEAEGAYETFEGLVDAHTGDLMAVTDLNQYLVRRTLGGVLPVSNDGLCQGVACGGGEFPDGVEQPAHPMPFANVLFPDGSTALTNTAGLGDFDGSFRTSLSGPYVTMVDTCGVIDEGTVCTDLDMGVNAPTETDCDVPIPGFSSPGNTRSSRTGFYELNRQVEMFRSRIAPGDPAAAFVNGLPTPLRAEMNIDQNCNANFNPATLDINFFTSGVLGSNVCRNTGEIAAVFDHEWGHFMDFIDGNGLSSPSEAYGDLAGITRLNDSCIGRGFFENNSIGGFCFGDGDPCTECTGVREDDFLKRQSQLPHDVDWAAGNTTGPPGGCAAPSPVPIPAPGAQSAPCGGGVHCNGSIVGEAMVDLIFRELPCQDAGGWENVPGDGSGPVKGGQCLGGAAPTMDGNTALEMVTQMFVAAKGNINQWFVCSNTVAGCGADSGYQQFLAADDDDGNLANGTPNHEAIFRAFDRHQLACPATAPPVLNTSCGTGALTPAKVTGLTLTPGVSQIELSWDADASALEYWIFRTEGALECTGGKKRIAVLDATAGTSYVDLGQDGGLEGGLATTAAGLLDGFPYYYTVMAVGTPGCLGHMSDCESAVPDPPSGGFAGGASIGIQQGTTSITSGDGDEFLDNCESATIGLTVGNDGGVNLTNVRIVSVQAVAPAGVSIALNDSLPIALGDLDSVCGAPGFAAASLNFTVESGLSENDVLTLEVGVLADEFSGVPQTGILVVDETENDFVPTAEILFDFDDGTLQGWALDEGTFTNNAGLGGETTTNFLKSSTAQDFACDKIRSPKLRLTASSELSLYNRFVTEVAGPGGVFTGFYDRANVGVINELGQRALVEPDGGRPYNAETTPGSTYAGCNEPERGWASDPALSGGGGADWEESTWSSTALGAGSYVGQTVRIEVINATDSTLSGEGLSFDQVRLTDVLLRGPDAFSDVCVGVDNQSPIAVNDSDGTLQDVPVTIDVLDNDSDPDADVLTINSVTDGGNGSVANNGGLDVTYTPNPGFFGVDTFTYEVCDDGGPSNSAAILCASATVTVTVEQVPDKCVEPGVEIHNDPEGDVGFLGSPGLEQHDVLSFSLSQDGDPALDNFIFTLKMVNLAAPLPNSTTWPVVFKDHVGADRYVRMWTDAAGDVFFAYGNGTNPSPFADAGTPAGATSSFDADGTIRIVVPGSAFPGVSAGDEFTAFITRIRVEGGGSALTPDNMPDDLIAAGEYEVVNCAVNEPPVANDDGVYNAIEGSTFTLPAPGLLANDTDPNGDSLTAVSHTVPAKGTLVANSDGSFDYTPFTGGGCLSGTDTFTYFANDGTVNSVAPATVTLNVSCGGDPLPPVANDDDFTMDEDTVLTDSVADDNGHGVDSDPDSLASQLTWNVLSGPSNGSLTSFDTATGDFTYMPNGNFHGSDSFTYELCDENPLCDQATVSITIDAVNDAPAAMDDAYSTDEDTTLVVSAPGVLGNDDDLDGDALAAELVSTTSSGSLTLNADGSFTYSPAADTNGPDTFTYDACDRLGSDPEKLCDQATVTITVDAVNDAPDAMDDTATTDQDTAVIITVLANDSDVDDAPGDLDVTAADDPANGMTTINPDNTITYTPDPGFSGTDFFFYTVCDPDLACDNAGVTVTVNSAGAGNVPDGDQTAYLTSGTIEQAVAGLTEGDECTFRMWVGKRSDGAGTFGRWFVQLTTGDWYIQQLMNGRLDEQAAQWEQHEVSFTVQQFPTSPIKLRLLGEAGFTSIDVVELYCNGGSTNLLTEISYEDPATGDGTWNNGDPNGWTLVTGGGGVFNPDEDQMAPFSF